MSIVSFEKRDNFKQFQTKEIKKYKPWGKPLFGLQKAVSPSNVDSMCYPFTAPAVRPEIIYFWKNTNSSTMGSEPAMEKAISAP